MTEHHDRSAATEYVLMPREATRAMTMAGCDSLPSCEHVFGHAGEMLRNAYRRMVEAGRITDVAQAVGMREVLVKAEAAFECIRLTLVGHLDEPERTAFWKAVEARNAVRSTLASQPSPAATVETDPTKDDFAKWSRVWHDTCETIVTLLGLRSGGSPEEMLADVQAYLAPRSSAGNGDAWPSLKMALWRVLMDERLNDGHYIAAFEFIEKLYAAAAPHAQRIIKFEVEDYVRDYEFRGDGGDHKPTEAEQELLIDAIHGVIYQIEQRIPAQPQAAPVTPADALAFPSDHQG